MIDPNRCREARKLAGLSVGQAARKLGATERFVVEAEQHRGPFEPATLERLAAAYDVHLAWLSGDCPASLSTDDPRVNRIDLAKLTLPDRDKLLRTLAAVLGPPKETPT